jgi:sialate O-acetylesterase
MAELGWPPARQASDPGTPSVLWNGMIAPLVPSAIRGVIWYQGESNRERAEQYRRLFPALIQDWRAAFGRGDFPFYFVQLAPFGYPGDTGEAARVRDAQRLALALPNTGMAVTMDIGDPADIHPLKKREVGERLALWALAKTYGRAGECSGPLHRSSRIEKNFVRVQFDHAAGLTSHGEPVRCVVIAGVDRVFHPVEARIRGEGLAVSSPNVPAPLAVRFGWGAADRTNLWNAAGLPAASFRTDDWP